MVKITESVDLGELYSKLICPKCKILMAPPIFVCALGHNCCEDCKDQYPCFVCNKPIETTRNFGLEQKTRSITYSCKWKNECNTTETAANIRNHESNCSFRKYKCPVPYCDWWGLSYTVSEHFKKKHPHLQFWVSNELEKTGEREDLWYMQCYNEIFACKYSYEKDLVEFNFWFTGTASQAKCFRCFIEFGAEGSKRYPMILKSFGPKFELELSYIDLHPYFANGDYRYTIKVFKF